MRVTEVHVRGANIHKQKKSIVFQYCGPGHGLLNHKVRPGCVGAYKPTVTVWCCVYKTTLRLDVCAKQ